MATEQSSGSEAEPVPPPTELASYTARLQSAIIPPTRIAGALPLGSSLAYERTLDRAAAKELDAVSGRVLGLVDRLVQYAGGKGKGKALSIDDLLDSRGYRSVVGDVLDQLLENADVCLDEFAGRNKAPAIAVKAPATKPTQPRRLAPSILHAVNLPKPQLKFRTPIDNTPLTSPYIPPPHPNQCPYATAPPSSLLVSYPPAPITTFESTPFTFVDTPAALKLMVASLKGSTEIALDLEHNSLRTYKGLVCLIQLSSRTQDWVIDALALRDEMEPLRGVLEDPKVVKVLHGAESDIVWLQRDFGLWVVGLFDTFHASKVLGFPKHSLAALLARYTDFVPDKQYQLADWRIRPLPEEMLHYARADTHFLLHIYDQLQNALLEHSSTHPPLPPTPLNGTPPPDVPVPTSTSTPALALEEEQEYPWAIVRVLARSATTAGRTYMPETPDPAGLAKRWDIQLPSPPRSRSGSPASANDTTLPAPRRPIDQKAAVFESIFWWRDALARSTDESPIYVLANTALFQIATHAPRSVGDVSKAVPRLSSVARSDLEGLVKAVGEGVERARRETEEWERGVKERERQEAEKSERVLKERQEVVVAAATGVGVGETVVVDLWSQLGSGQKAAPPIARTSALFGPSRTSAPPTFTPQQKLKQKAAHSTLFGPKPTISNPQPISQTPFDTLRNKIHGAISDAPRMVMPQSDDAPPAPASQAPISASTSTSQITAPAPTHTSRTTAPKPTPPPAPPAPASIEPDEIVPVAQPRPKSKKRKPVNAPNTSVSGPSSKKARAGELSAEPIEAFDYASAPNILDSGVGEEQGRRREREKKKAPPKAQSEQKGGNRTHTFK
ncbi:hypothetical protein BDV93DRAFT_542586 [Ceratobasidium sp. AG-I]|nr:hypothetical protein BDV93DRAFT_542586 [Ceratobasidium sp. AG-I]